MNPFRRLTINRFTQRILRWQPLHGSEIAIERPPRSRPPRGRIQIIWRGDPALPFAFETEEPPDFGDLPR